MSFQARNNQEIELKPRISVIGVGGAGGNAVNNMIRSQLEGVEFIVANTDAQALAQSHVSMDKRIQLGFNVTQGLGAGSKPDVGRASAEESLEEIIGHLSGSNMVFITAGMGGGTGTGAAPAIAKAVREIGILTVGVVTRPFDFEGPHRQRTAEKGIEEMQQFVDTLIIIPNQNLFRIANERTTLQDAFHMADNVLTSGVRNVTDLMIRPGLINLDFADVRSVMAEMGKAMMGTGEAEGENRAIEAAQASIDNPLLDDVTMSGARGVLINVTGGHDMTLHEVDEAAQLIRKNADPEANIIFGSTFDEKLNGRIRISVVATGIGGKQQTSQTAAQQASQQQQAQQQSATTQANPFQQKPWQSAPESKPFTGGDLNQTSAATGFTAGQNAGQETKSSSLFMGMGSNSTTSGTAGAPGVKVSSFQSPESQNITLPSDILSHNDGEANRSLNATNSISAQEDLNNREISVNNNDMYKTDYYDNKASGAYADKTAEVVSSIVKDVQTQRAGRRSLFDRFRGNSSNNQNNGYASEDVIAHNNQESQDDHNNQLDIPAFLRRK